MNPLLFTSVLVLLESQAYQIVFTTNFCRRTVAKWYVAWPATIFMLWLTNSYIALNFPNSLTKSILILLVNLAISMVFYKASVFVRFYMVTFVYVLIITADILFVVGYSYLSSFFTLTNELGWLLDGISFIPKILVILILLILKKWFFTIKLLELQNKTPIIFSVALMFVNLVIVFQLASDAKHGFTAALSSTSLVIMDLLLYHFLLQYSYGIRHGSQPCLFPSQS